MSDDIEIIALTKIESVIYRRLFMSVNDQKFELDNGTFYVDYRPSNEKPYYVMSLGRKDNLVYEGEFKTEREAYDHIQLCVKCKVANRWEKYTCCMECIIG